MRVRVRVGVSARDGARGADGSNPAQPLVLQDNIARLAAHR